MEGSAFLPIKKAFISWKLFWFWSKPIASSWVLLLKADYEEALQLHNNGLCVSSRNLCSFASIFYMRYI